MPSLTTHRENSITGTQPSSSVCYGSLEAESPLSDEQPKTKSHYTRINVSDLKNITTKQVRTIFHKCFNEFFSLFQRNFFDELLVMSFFVSGIKKSGSILQTNEMVFRYFLAIYGIAFHQSHSDFGIFAGY